MCDDVTCRGELHDTIVNFGESLPKEDVIKSKEHSLAADLCLSLGSSLQVKPACHMPRITAKNGGKLVIVNL